MSDMRVVPRAAGFVGPVYVAHPYWDPSPERRLRNVESAAVVSSLLNRMGIATISPLQESRGREGAVDESLWLPHGLRLLSVCLAIVVCDGWYGSRGCKVEIAEAERLGIRVFHSWLGGDEFGAFVAGPDIISWRDSFSAHSAEERRIANG